MTLAFTLPSRKFRLYKNKWDFSYLDFVTRINMEKKQDGLMWFTISIYCVKTEVRLAAMAKKT